MINRSPKNHSNRLKAIGALLAFIFTSQITTKAYGIPVEFQRKEAFFCGRLGIVIIRSSNNASQRSGRVTYNAQLEIPGRQKIYSGVLHNFMGGNDRTFTRHASDGFRSIDDTSAANPVMMSMRMGPHFYGKRREEISIALLQEAYTCIPR